MSYTPHTSLIFSWNAGSKILILRTCLQNLTTLAQCSAYARLKQCHTINVCNLMCTLFRIYDFLTGRHPISQWYKIVRITTFCVYLQNVLFWNNISFCTDKRYFTKLLPINCYRTLFKLNSKSHGTVTLLSTQLVSRPHTYPFFIPSHWHVTQSFPPEIIPPNPQNFWLCVTLSPQNLMRKKHCLKRLYPFQAPIRCYLIEWLISGPLPPTSPAGNLGNR
jgi:hypothetical protein